MGVEIIGEAEYRLFMEFAKGSGLDGTEFHTFHDQFCNLIHEYIPADNEVCLDETYELSRFPKTGGIYFCVRRKYCGWSEVWYVGKTSNFRDRWQKHHKFAALMAIKDVIVYCLEVDSSKEQIGRLEEICIRMLSPVFNNNSRQNDVMRCVS